MRVYTPVKLARIVDQIEEDFPMSGGILKMLAEAELQALVLLINRKEFSELDSFSVLLTRREIQSLCRYLRTNSYDVDLNKIERVIMNRMDSACFSILFSVWEYTPESAHALRLLGLHDNAECRPDGFALEKGLLERWSLASQPILAVTRTIADQSHEMPYRTRIQLIGFNYGTALALECEKLFFFTARWRDFLTEGDSYLEEMLKRLSKSDKENLLIQLLKTASEKKTELKLFSQTYKIAYALWGKPSVKTFPENQTLAFATYSWWCNYSELFAILHGDPRRIHFWETYIDQLECSRNLSHKMLMMRYKDLVITEFEELGAIYVFKADYFDSVVQNQMAIKTTSLFKSWLWNHSSRMYRETHRGYWESRMRTILRRLNIR